MAKEQFEVGTKASAPTADVTKAQENFTTRKSEEGDKIENGTDFKTWYHNEDVIRMLWALYQALPKEKKEDFLAPYVFFDTGGFVSFDKLMTIAKRKFLLSNKLYFPFIIKPELGGAHYTAGIFRREADSKVTLFFFNPVGYPDEEAKQRAKKRLQLPEVNRVGGMDLVLCPYEVQTSDKDGGVLVSCGPISVEFVNYALNNPDWIASLDDKFQLPPHLVEYKSCSTEVYKLQVLQLRKEHYTLLQQVPDSELTNIEDDWAAINQYFLDSLDSGSDKDVELYQENGKRGDLFEDDSYVDDSYVNEDNEDDLQSDYEDDPLSDEEDGVAIQSTKTSQASSASEKASHAVSVIGSKKDSDVSCVATSIASSNKDNDAPLIPVDDHVKGTSPSGVAKEDTVSGHQSKLINDGTSTPSYLRNVKGVAAIEQEILRLRNATGFFSLGAKSKATKIEQALEQAKVKSSDVRLDTGVRTALSEHRIFSFFGLKTTQALQNVDRSLEEENNQLPTKSS
ncbi:hypothetical protein [Legionella hackeliae]|uniref:Uncharacterized protein n=1 Tax=Legionella hackeliae TaxID=449 RepID=A0A0A8UUS5_LEGHA|nr:hypothetical protein [Legionella hackeliae]KTD15373.1 hypothetical protein Lhac_0215 [Legionella hackeliae]CEK11261.1 protein of unknown function [Legionella hackeliae]STX48026.1 Uncharacterised protein [Legionella hackeliae]